MDGAFRKRAAVGCAVFVLAASALTFAFKDSPDLWQILLYETLPFYGYAGEDSFADTYAPVRIEQPEITPKPEPELDVA